MTQRIKVGVFGASGYAGLDLVSILSQHPNVDIVFATSNTFNGEFVPKLDLRYIPSEQAKFEGVDAVFLALPHKTSAQFAKRAKDAGVVVIDLSADLRIETAQEYEKWYHVVHPHPELLPVPYGLPELHRDQIKETRIVACPGCYATTTILGLYPLLQVQGLEVNAPIIVDAKSGVSGAGRVPSDFTHFVEVYGNLKPYKTGRKHQHIGEIEQEINKFGDYRTPLVFTPHLLPIDRGLMASLYVTLNYNMTSEKVHSLYNNVYNDEPLVEVLPIGEDATIKHAVYTNKCVVSVNPVTENLVHITSVTDNLRKGASSQAVQCFNLMFNLPEITALL
jgi:N-acetyl-gamma-glutamyl-phosphate reductase